MKVARGQKHLTLKLDDDRKVLDLTSLAKSSLESVAISGAPVKLPKAWPGLKKLAIFDRITNWQVLAGYPQLVELDTGLFSDIDTIGWLAAMPRLRRLDLDVGALASIDEVGALANLRELTLRGYKMDLAPLARLAQLRLLRLQLGQGVRGIASLAALTRLEVLSIGEAGLADLDFCAALTNLRDLRILGAGADVAGLAGL
ncbi:MAG: hypothetical protein NT062_24210, partial [Proteobacteria bacterium]|nr:hypothetical protein [Pseudomonadota bacterium]